MDARFRFRFDVELVQSSQQEKLQMTLSKTEREMLWVDGWNELDTAVSNMSYLVNQAWQVVGLTECRALIQQTAYEHGLRVRFRQTFHRGKPSLQFFFA